MIITITFAMCLSIIFYLVCTQNFPKQISRQKTRKYDNKQQNDDLNKFTKFKCSFAFQILNVFTSFHRLFLFFRSDPFRLFVCYRDSLQKKNSLIVYLYVPHHFLYLILLFSYFEFNAEFSQYHRFHINTYPSIRCLLLVECGLIWISAFFLSFVFGAEIPVFMLWLTINWSFSQFFNINCTFTNELECCLWIPSTFNLESFGSQPELFIQIYYSNVQHEFVFFHFISRQYNLLPIAQKDCNLSCHNINALDMLQSPFFIVLQKRKIKMCAGGMTLTLPLFFFTVMHAVHLVCLIFQDCIRFQFLFSFFLGHTLGTTFHYSFIKGIWAANYK